MEFAYVFCLKAAKLFVVSAAPTVTIILVIV